MKNYFTHIRVFYFRFLKKTCRILFCIILTSSLLQAQNASSPANKVKAVFLFNFTRFIDWPETSFASPEAPFVIGIIGKNPFGSYIEESVAGEKVGKHPIVVQHFNDESEIVNCHILYINFSDDLQVKETITAAENRSILTVGERSDFISLGGIVRFYTEQNKIRLQINTDAAKTARLNISSKLLSVAKTN